MVRRFGREIAAVLVWNPGIAAAVAGLITWMSPQTRPSAVWRTLVISLVYSNSVGTLAGLLMPRLAPRFARRSPTGKWGLYVGRLIGITLAGCALAGGKSVRMDELYSWFAGRRMVRPG